MKRLVIDRRVLRDNIEAVKKQAKGAAIYAVLSADAYGLGLLESAKLLREAGITRYAVSDVWEARALRSGGFVEEEILMLRSTMEAAELEELMDLNVVCTVGSYEAGVVLNGMAEARSCAAEVHLELDSGMGFGGLSLSEPEKILSVFRHMSSLAVSGMYTHIPQAHSKENEASHQLEGFLRAVQYVRDAGFDPGVIHAAGSNALFRSASARLDAVRVGSAFFGRSRLGKRSGIAPACRLEVKVDEVRWLNTGDTVGTQKLVKIKKPTRVARIPLGTADGFGVYSGSLSFFGALELWREMRRLEVKLGRSSARLIGKPGIHESLIDVTDVDCSPGDTVTVEADPLLMQGLDRYWEG